MSSIFSDAFFMKKALEEADKASSSEDVPVGAVIVHKNKIIARSCNQVELLGDPTAHAEMLAITQAANFLKSKWLTDCVLYVTIEPCSMCAGALVLSRLSRVVYGASDPKTGAGGSVLNILHNKKLNHRIKVNGGVLKEDCAAIIKDFFRKQRARDN
ncbi:MAG: tRNA adenosine(34) deaminase TadA [Candidatus Omnitrophica bacterium]|nr:tRNA adenosine(34) deaminase TadA [Candidatus Omnitrophota bacterium]